MIINYRVESKASANSPWRFTGIIESNKEIAAPIWDGIIAKLRYHSYRFVAITYGIPIDRSRK